MENIVKKHLNEARLKKTINRNKRFDPLLKDILTYAFDGPHHDIGYDSLTLRETDIISPEQFKVIQGVINGEQQITQDMYPVIKNLLHYLYHDINWEYDSLNDTEKEIIPQNEFLKLETWVYGN